MKFQTEMTITITAEDMRRMLTDALCIWSLENLRVANVFEAEGKQFVVVLQPKARPMPQPPQIRAREPAK